MRALPKLRCEPNHRSARAISTVLYIPREGFDWLLRRSQTKFEAIMPRRTGCTNCGIRRTGMITLLTLTRRYSSRNIPVRDFENFCDSWTEADSVMEEKVLILS